MILGVKGFTDTVRMRELESTHCFGMIHDRELLIECCKIRLNQLREVTTHTNQYKEKNSLKS